MTGRMARGSLAAGAVGIMFMLGSAGAEAVFPGKNGRILGDDGGNVYSVNKKTGSARNLTEEVIGEAGDPAASPNGRLVVLTVDEQLALMRRDGSNFRFVNSPVLRGFTIAHHPTFSRDGKWIVFTADNGIAKIRKNGTGFQALTNSMSDSDPVFHPRKNLIFFEREGDEEEEMDDIYRMKPNGTRIRAVTSTPNRDEDDPQFTPDGRKLLVSSDKAGGPEQIEIMKPDGTRRKALTKNNMDSDEQAVSPDGRLIVFRERPMQTKRRGSTGNTFTMRINGKGKRRLPVGGSLDGLANYDWLVR